MIYFRRARARPCGKARREDDTRTVMDEAE